MGNMPPVALISMNFVNVIASMILDIQAYIVYHDFKTADVTWLDFDDNSWAQLPRATYIPSVVQLITSIVTIPGSINTSPRLTTVAATLPHLIPSIAGTCISPTILSTFVVITRIDTTISNPINYSTSYLTPCMRFKYTLIL